MGELSRATTTRILEGSEVGFATTRFDDLLNWAKKYSLFQYPFVTACCAMEFMAMASPRFDMARFGAEAPRFSPRQADLLWVVGTISQRQAPALKRIYEQMAEKKLIDQHDLSIVKITDDVDEAIAWIKAGIKPRGTYP